MDTNTWLLVVGGVLLLAGFVAAWLIWGRQQHVEIARPSLDSGIAGPTLERVAVKREPTLAELHEQLKTFDPPVVDRPLVNPDNLMLIKGVGPRLAKTLYNLGIHHFSEIAAWTPDDVRRIDSVLGPFAGRIDRDRWIEQAELLAGGDMDAFEAKFGNMQAGVGQPGMPLSH